MCFIHKEINHRPLHSSFEEHTWIESMSQDKQLHISHIEVYMTKELVTVNK